MKSIIILIFLICLMINSIAGFTMTSSRCSRSKGGQLTMGNNAKFGIFSPAVVVAKFVIGEAKLNKVSFVIYAILLFDLI